MKRLGNLNFYGKIGRRKSDLNNRMVYVRLKAGMGNQMFQYAFGRLMAHKLGTKVKIDLSLLLDRARGKDYVYRNYDLTIFEVPNDFVIAPKILKTLYRTKSSKVCKMVRNQIARGKNYIKEPHFEVSEEILNNPKDNTIYEGWWQSEQYFQSIEEEIRQVFSFKNPILEKSKTLVNEIESTQAICLNVRRTDFVSTSNLNVTNKDYFVQAAEKMASMVEQPHFFIFSDDVEWCAENLNLNYPTTLVSHEHKGEKFGNYMQLMKACKHFIIPNSSFAWWAVWLNQHKNKIVIAPKNWFNDNQYDTSDLVPKTWIRL